MFANFRKPLGVVLSGGGALGAWQAGCLDALTRGGLEFDKVLGFSAGALSGAAYFLSRFDELLHRWRNVDQGRILRLAPRLRPFSLFSNSGIWEAVQDASVHAPSRHDARGELIIVSLCLENRLPVYSRFTPKGQGGWDGPLAARLVASCSIPQIFPPVRIEEKEGARTYVDGGVVGKEWIHCKSLEGCRDVIVIEMSHPEESRAAFWGPLRRTLGRPANEDQVVKAIDSLSSHAEPPRIFRFYPTRPLAYSPIAYKNKHCAPAVDQGILDGEQFLKNPERYLL